MPQLNNRIKRLEAVIKPSDEFNPIFMVMIGGDGLIMPVKAYQFCYKGVNAGVARLVDESDEALEKRCITEFRQLFPNVGTAIIQGVV